MPKLDVIIDYSRTPDNEVVTLSQTVQNKLTGNTHFKFDAALLTLLQERTTDYNTKLIKSKTGTSQDVAEKNAAKTLVFECFHEIALEVNLQAKGDLIKLQSSGLTLVKEPKKVGELPKPEKFKVIGGANQGDFQFSVEANKNALFYNFYSAPVPAPANINEWRLTPSTTHKKNVSGFTPGKEYEFKCAYQGATETIVLSDTIKAFAH